MAIEVGDVHLSSRSIHHSISVQLSGSNKVQLGCVHPLAAAGKAKVGDIPLSSPTARGAEDGHR